MRGKRGAGLVGQQVSVADKSRRDTLVKGQRLESESGIRKSSGLKQAGHGRRDTEGFWNQVSMVVPEVGVRPDKSPSRRERRQAARQR